MGGQLNGDSLTVQGSRFEVPRSRAQGNSVPVDSFAFRLRPHAGPFQGLHAEQNSATLKCPVLTDNGQLTLTTDCGGAAVS